jgi:hypothetical protein
LVVQNREHFDAAANQIVIPTGARAPARALAEEPAVRCISQMPTRPRKNGIFTDASATVEERRFSAA